MRLTKWAPTMVVLLIVTGIVFAEAQKGSEPSEKGQDQRLQMRRSTDAVRARTAGGREQMYRQRMARQAEMHRVEIAELIAIKKIAEEENATKTAEAIQALIDKKNTEYKENIEQVERARRERAERLQERMKKAEQLRKKTDEGAEASDETATDESAEQGEGDSD